MVRRLEVSRMRFEVDPHRVVHETIDGEAILIHMKTGFYYSLEGAGSEIWSELVAGCTPEEIAGLLRTRYDAAPGAIETAVSTLVEELRAEGLVDESSGSAANGKPPSVERLGDASPGREAFEAPVLHRYTDMADFMLVDPIHEVDETGWPNRKVAP
jgi:hypothetical protein